MIALFVYTGLGLAVLVISLAVMKRGREAFNERFPPISDAEFLTRCSPGVNAAVALKIREIVAEYFAIDYARVYPSMTFIEDIGAD